MEKQELLWWYEVQLERTMFLFETLLVLICQL